VETADLMNFENAETHLLLNPRLPDADREQFERLYAAAPPLAAHVWMATSGTTGGWKLTALSRDALLASAAAVNRHLRSTSRDVWISVLPGFHVGGMGIRARAELSGARLVFAPWSAESFASVCARESATLSALVPAQVRDLVQAGLRAPAPLRAIVVGGGALAPGLYAEARTLGWNVLPSYGMTECCSQIATAALESLEESHFPELVLLDHLEARATAQGRLAFRGSSLITGYMRFDEDGMPRFVDPKENGWFISEDVGRVQEREGRQLLVVEGRRGDFVKIGGESVDLQRLDRILEGVLHDLRSPIDAAIVLRPDGRLGQVIHLAATGEAAAIAGAFNERVLPFERVRGVEIVGEIPRTALGKLIRKKLG
jgi:O-succinylbenzoic acid--CoA ligase